VCVELDCRQIGRVVKNLVSNALRYTAEGGTVTVKATLQGTMLLTEVTDTGVGVAPEDVPKLFDRFWQFDTSSTRIGGGLGLGLPIAKAIVVGHGGTIGARSQLEVGSTFWFTLSTASDS
jgi:signal transduction histidine kinase